MATAHKETDPAQTCDPITLEIIFGVVRSMMREMAAAIERTAMSPFIREKKDFDASVFDANGRLVANSGLGGMTNILDPIFELYPIETMEPGDIYWYNDCYGSKGAVSHSPDQVFARPIFSNGRIVAFVQSWAHFNDIGGMRPGSLSPDCTEIFQEGTMIPPVRLARGDVVNEELLRIFTRNSRFPDMVRGDVRALLAAVRLGEKRLQEAYARFGDARMADALRQIVDHSGDEVIARARQAIPAGDYDFTEFLDSDGHGNGPFAISLKLKVSDNRITLDASDTSDQSKGPFNFLAPPGMMESMLARMLLKGDKRFSTNEGTARVIDEVILREGSLLRPHFPAALGLRGVTAARVEAAWLGLFAKASHGQSNASSCSSVVCYLRGNDDAGQPFLMTDPLGVGYGARPYADGNDGIYLVANENYPAEFVETSFPLRVRSYALQRDSGGAGRYRGGCGVIRELEVLAPEAMFAIRMDSIKFPPWGLSGGKNGGRGSVVVNPGRADEREVPAISDGTVLKRGDVVRIVTGGGGGWGHPHDREPERVLADVLGGFVSVESARRDYGVAIDAAIEGEERIDEAATAKLRAERYETKLFHRDEYIDIL